MKTRYLLASGLFALLAFALQGQESGFTNLPTSSAPAVVWGPLGPQPHGPGPVNGALNLALAVFEEDFEDFQNDQLPVAWTSSADPSGGFYIGTATDANQNGFWPVPAHTKFAMSNDDVCNCNSSEDYLILPTLDFTNLQNMALSFESFDNRTNSLPSEVQINTGSGWSTLFVIPEATSWLNLLVPLTGTDGLSSVQLRFHFDDGGNHAAGLAIDDIVIAPLNTNDLEITTVFYNQTSDPASQRFYTMIPRRQALSTPLAFGAQARNLGSATQTNTHLEVNVSGPESYQALQGNASINSFQTALLDITTPFILQSIGTYTIDFEVASVQGEDAPEDNTKTDQVEVTDRIYARDNGNYQGAGYWAGAGSGYRVALRYDIQTIDTVTGIQVLLQDGTQSGSQITLSVHRDSLTGPGLVSSSSQTLTLSEIGAWTTFPLAETTLIPGTYYVILEATSGNVLPAIDPEFGLPAPNTSFVDLPMGPWTPSQVIPFLRMQVRSFVDPCAAALVSNVSDISCFGLADGFAAVDIPGNTATYQWSNASTADSIGNLAAGTYTVTVSYGTGCTLSQTFVIAEPGPLNITESSIAEVCGDAAGQAIPVITGGTPPFAGAWDHGATDVVATGLAAGNYTVTITDSRGCTESAPFTVSGTPAATATVNTFEPTCQQSDGNIGLVPLTGPGPYTYTWSHDPLLTDSAAGSLAAGIYHVTMTDSNGCSFESIEFLANQGAPTLASDQLTDITCNGDSSGSIETNTTGGTAPYQYTWSNGSTNEDLSNATAGIYFATVTDALGCSNFLTDTLSQPDTLEAELELLAEILCFGDSTASVTATATGGVPGYTYTWSTGTTADTISDIWAGPLAVTVTDGNSCESVYALTVPSPDVISITAQTITPDDTLPGSQGAIAVSVAGGTAPYTFLWSNGLNLQNISNLQGGRYYVTVTDINDCQAIDSFFVAYPTGLNALFVSDASVTLFPNPTDGILQIQSSQVLTNIRVFSLEGREVGGLKPTDVAVQRETLTIDLQHLSPGTYLLTGQADQAAFSRLIVLQ